MLYITPLAKESHGVLGRRYHITVWMVVAADKFFWCLIFFKEQHITNTLILTGTYCMWTLCCLLFSLMFCYVLSYGIF